MYLQLALNPIVIYEYAEEQSLFQITSITFITHVYVYVYI